MKSLDDNNESQRFKSFRAVIPFYILFDLDLTGQHFRFYGQIEQLESNPNPKVNATFSYSWIALELNITRRQAMKIAKLLVDKGYIEHTEVKKGKFLWSTKKAQVVCDDDDSVVSSHDTTWCPPTTPPGVLPRHPKIPEDKILKDNNKTPISPTAKNDLSISFETLNQNNPHNITETLINEWKEFRKKPITSRVWNKTNNVMTQLSDKGLPALEAFEILLEKQWQGMEVRYFNDEIKYRNDGGNLKEKSGDLLFMKLANSHKTQGATIDEYGNCINSFG